VYVRVSVLHLIISSSKYPFITERGRSCGANLLPGDAARGGRRGGQG
jgi:hypothetical protein